MNRPSARRTPFPAGLFDIAPILVGVFPFGLIAGIAAVEAGLGSVQAYATSPIVFAGASQLAMIDLIGRDAAPIVIVTTVLVINARMAMYSAALAPAFRNLSPLRKAYGSYVITDQSFAVSIIRFDHVDETLSDRFSYYMGASLGLWVTWQISSLVGVIIGSGVPEEWSLDFAVPLVFLALVFPAIKDRASTIAAVTAATSAVVFVSLPLNLGLLVASGLGLAAGVIWGRE
ncbi:MAG: AzlC family ABC transporter permease [Acidimicrobiia bacterium]